MSGLGDRVARRLKGERGIWKTIGKGQDRHEVFDRHWAGSDGCMIVFIAADGRQSIRPLTFDEVVEATLAQLRDDVPDVPHWESEGGAIGS